MIGVKKAELIEGVVYIPSPVSAEEHGEPHFEFNGWLYLYRAQTPGVRGGDNSTLRLDLDNEPQPDAYLRLLPECGGQARIAEGYLEGAPELIAEIAASSASYDMHDKLNVYRRNQVREYVVWRVWDRQIDWFILSAGRYEKLQMRDGVYRSQVFPGLWLDCDAAIASDSARVVQTLKRGLSSPGHKEFAERIRGLLGN